MPSVLRNVQSAKAQMISAPTSKISAVRRPEGESRYVFISYRSQVAIVPYIATCGLLKHRKLFRPRVFRLWRRGGGGLALGLGQELGQAAKIGFDQRAILRLVERGGGVHHRHDKPPANLLRLTVDARDLLALKPLRHREAPECDDHTRVDRGDLALQIAGAGGDLVRLRVAVVRRAVLHDI